MSDTAARRGRPYATFDLGQLESRPPRVAVTASASLFAVAADLAGADRGSPAQWVAAARSQLDPADLAVLRPIGARAGTFTPGRVLVNGVNAGDSVAEDLERIATLPVEYLLDDIAFAFGPSPPPPWNVVARQPRRWLIRYAQALGRVWDGLREPWAAAAALVDREIERVETAAARGALPELMAGLHHRAEVRDGTWRLADDDWLTLRLSERGLVITPVLGGPEAARATYNEAGILRAITYPLPGTAGLLSGAPPTPGEALESLLGRQRAKLLRMLDQPVHAGRLAEALCTTPGSTTHHLRALEASGLIVRERSGRFVMVHRTARGSALLGMYEDG
jgi:DNA-binding transcriptional ArsR family regulator